MTEASADLISSQRKIESPLVPSIESAIESTPTIPRLKEFPDDCQTFSKEMILEMEKKNQDFRLLMREWNDLNKP